MNSLDEGETEADLSTKEVAPKETKMDEKVEIIISPKSVILKFFVVFSQSISILLHNI